MRVVPSAQQAAARQTRPRGTILLGQLTPPVRHLLVTEAGSSVLLLGATVIALLWANSPLSDSYESLWSTELVIGLGDHEIAMDLRHWVNDGLMAMFFFLIGLEVRREISVGELKDHRKLVLPVIGAVGGLVVPAALYLAINPSGDAANGWGVVIGTDTAFLLGILALVGPSMSTQLRVFLLTTTIADDVIAVSVIGAVYSDSIDLGAVAIAAASLGVLASFGPLGVWRTSIYGIVGLVLWVATIESGLHSAIAGMLAGLVIVAYPPQRDAVERASALFRAFQQSPLPSVGDSARVGLQRAVSVNERLQEALRPWTSLVIVPVFALANTGIDLRGGLLGDALSSPLTWGVVLGLVVGKPVGITLATLGADRLELGGLPQGVRPGHVAGGAALSGIGFTVSLLIAGLAFDSPALREQATVGVLVAAVFSTMTGWLTFRLAALLRGERAASLPMVLDRPVEVGRDHIRGRADAPLTLVEYGDFECPFCGEATGVVRELRERFGDDLRYVFRHLPLTDVHHHAELAAQAAEAVHAQGHFWEMHDLLFQHQDELELEDLIGYVANLGLDAEQFARDLASGRFAETVRQDTASAEASGARGTPTFFVGTRRHVGAWDTGTLASELSRLGRTG